MNTPVFIEIQNMNFAVRHTTCCVSDVLLISLSPVFRDTLTQRLVVLSRMPNSKVHVLYLNEYWSDKVSPIRSTSLTQFKFAYA